jgi:hypothetical protein
MCSTEAAHGLRPIGTEFCFPGDTKYVYRVLEHVFRNGEHYERVEPVGRQTESGTAYFDSEVEPGA